METILWKAYHRDPPESPTSRGAVRLHVNMSKKVPRVRHERKAITITIAMVG
jgi:hypothetical protein